MALSGLGLELGPGQEAEVCIDSTVLGLMQRTLSLEEKVGQLFELLRDPVYLYLIAVLSNPAEAEDITQEAFLRLYRTLHSGQAITNVRFFLFRVAHNLAFDAREKSQHYESVDTRTWDELRQLLPDPGLNPESGSCKWKDSRGFTRQWRGSRRRNCNVFTSARKDFVIAKSAKFSESIPNRRRSFCAGASGS